VNHDLTKERSKSIAVTWEFGAFSGDGIRELGSSVLAESVSILREKRHKKVL
jgi:hypothetical protein